MPERFWNGRERIALANQVQKSTCIMNTCAGTLTKGCRNEPCVCDSDNRPPPDCYWLFGGGFFYLILFFITLAALPPFPLRLALRLWRECFCGNGSGFAAYPRCTPARSERAGRALMS